MSLNVQLSDQHGIHATASELQIAGSLLNVLSDLEDLGCADSIARRLWGLSICGRWHNSYRCPLSLYLKRFVGEGKVMVADATMIVMLPHNTSVQLALPYHVSSFVRRFDAGEYPFLLDPDIEAGVGHDDPQSADV
jgi:hypothetical protein